MKIIYIAHPIRGNDNGGSIRTNVFKVTQIVERILLSESKAVFPVAPYLEYLRILEDTDIQRERCFKYNKKFFELKMVDELWICGEVSAGVKQEIEWAKEFDIPAFYYSEILRAKFHVDDLIPSFI